MPMITIVVPNLTEITQMGMPELDELSIEEVHFEINVTLTGEFWVSDDNRIKVEINDAPKAYRDA